MVSIDIVYNGGLRCRATHGPSGETLTTDAPKDNHGRGEYFSPTDLVATAVGACMITIMGIVAERDRIDLTGTTVHVEKEMVADPVRRIGTIRVRMTMPAGVGEDERRKLEAAARVCPVRKSLGEHVETPVEFVWPAS